MDYRTLTSPCGIDCFNCELFEDNITPQMQQYLAQFKKVAPETIRCHGCRVSGCLVTPGECQTKQCVAAHGVEFCYECSEFPCQKLQPCQDGAETYPQNFKSFNLCRMKAVGVEKWAEEESAQIRRLYKTGKLMIGAGPVTAESEVTEKNPGA